MCQVSSSANGHAISEQLVQSVRRTGYGSDTRTHGYTDTHTVPYLLVRLLDLVVMAINSFPHPTGPPASEEPSLRAAI